MDATLLDLVALLRAAVGLLGEREQHGWWQSGFFAAGSGAFLTPVFGRTALLAQCAGVTRAAARVHDERIGVGRVFHLFRLPEAAEQGLHQALQQPALAARLAETLATPDTALRQLQTLAGPAHSVLIGPALVGPAAALGQTETWRAVAGLYAGAFAAGHQTFPFLTDAR